ncbi:MAG: hypothetical protein HC888_06900 [Candidatus Competibacteraceae bacterium]|nr:hypothetical protein [Candidatus Competibacteraceae bacterium]
MNDENIERRKSGLPIERWILVVFAGATLAFSFYESAGSYLDSLHDRIEQLMRDQAIHARDLEFARAELSAIARRVELIETKYVELRERIGSKSQ